MIDKPCHLPGREVAQEQTTAGGVQCQDLKEVALARMGAWALGRLGEGGATDPILDASTASSGFFAVCDAADTPEADPVRRRLLTCPFSSPSRLNRYESSTSKPVARDDRQVRQGALMPWPARERSSQGSRE